MKKTRFILGVIAAIAAAAMTGCQLELNNTEDRVSVGGYAVKSIEISGGTKSFVIGTAFTKGDLKVVAHSYDPAEAEAGVEVTEYTVDSSAFKSTQAGTYTITVKYGNTIIATYDVEVAEATDIKEATLVTKNAGWTGSASTSEFWQDMGGPSDAKVAAGSVVSSKFTVNSNTTSNWAQLPCVVLRSKDGGGAETEYVVVRGDNFGWGGSYEGCELSSDWNWDEFIPWTNGATCTVSVINWGNGTAEVRYDLEKDGTTHFQYYKNIKVDADVFFRLKGDAGTNITFAE